MILQPCEGEEDDGLDVTNGKERREPSVGIVHELGGGSNQKSYNEAQGES